LRRNSSNPATISSKGAAGGSNSGRSKNFNSRRSGIDEGDGQFRPASARPPSLRADTSSQTALAA
jgi:hypothetical protein